MKDHFGTEETPGEPPFPRVSLKDARLAPHAPRPSHLAKTQASSPPRRPTRYVAPAMPGRGVSLEQWNALRKYAAELRRIDAALED